MTFDEAALEAQKKGMSVQQFANAGNYVEGVSKSTPTPPQTTTTTTSNQPNTNQNASNNIGSNIGNNSSQIGNNITYYSPATDNVAPFSNEQPQTSQSGLSAQQIRELDALVNKNQWTETDQKNYDYAVKTYGYTLPSTGKFDTGGQTKAGIEDLKNIKDTDPYILAYENQMKETDFANQEWVNTQLNENEKQINALLKQIEAINNRDLMRAEQERNVAKGTTENLVNQASAYMTNAIEEQYKKYTLDGQYAQLTSIGSQLMSLMAENTGKTMTTSMSSKYYRNVAMLTSVSQILQGNINYGLKLAGELYNADISGYQEKINYYNGLFTKADNNMISLSKDYKSALEKKISYYDKVIKQKEEDKKTVEDTVRNTNGNTLYRAMNNGYDLYDIYNEENQKKLLLATQEQNMVDSMAVKYPDVNILPTDSFETAYTKAQNSLNWGNELRDAGSDAMVINTMYDIHSQYPELTWDECYSMAVQEVNEINAAQKLAESGKTAGTATTQTEASEQDKRMFNSLNSLLGFDENGNLSDKSKRTINGLSGAMHGGKYWFKYGDYANLRTLLREISSVSQLSSFEEAKAKGATFGAMSEAEWDILKAAANPLTSAIKTDDKGNEYLALSQDKAIEYIENFYKKVKENIDKYEKPRGNVNDAQGQVIDFKVVKDGKEQTLFQCGEYINNKAGIKVGNTWQDKSNNVDKKGHKGSEGIQQGDVIFINTGTPYGHVAYVEGIDNNGNLIVSEANWVENNTKVGGKVRYGRLVEPNTIYGYIRPSEVK